MRGFAKTLFGDARTLCVCAICVGVSLLILHTALAPYAGVVLPLSLLAGAGYLARH